MKMPILWTKKALLSTFDQECFDQECFIWVFLGKNFKKTIVIFEISTLKLVFFQNFAKK